MVAEYFHSSGTSLNATGYRLVFSKMKWSDFRFLFKKHGNSLQIQFILSILTRWLWKQPQNQRRRESWTKNVPSLFHLVFVLSHWIDSVIHTENVEFAFNQFALWINIIEFIYIRRIKNTARTKIAATQRAFIWLFSGTWQTKENVFYRVFSLVRRFGSALLSVALAVRNAVVVVVVACSNIRWRVVAGWVGSHCSNKKWMIIKIICVYLQ